MLILTLIPGLAQANSMLQAHAGQFRSVLLASQPCSPNSSFPISISGDALAHSVPQARANQCCFPSRTWLTLLPDSKLVDSTCLVPACQFQTLIVRQMGLFHVCA